MGAPVAWCARAAASRTRSSNGSSSSSLATLMMPARTSVPSRPTVRSAVNHAASWSVVRTVSAGDGASHMPVAATICIPLRREDSTSRSTSRPRSKVVASTMVVTPSPMARVRTVWAVSRSRSRPPYRAGQPRTTPGEPHTMCSWESVKPRCLGLDRTQDGVDERHQPMTSMKGRASLSTIAARRSQVPDRRLEPGHDIGVVDAPDGSAPDGTTGEEARRAATAGCADELREPIVRDARGQHHPGDAHGRRSSRAPAPPRPPPNHRRGWAPAPCRCPSRDRAPRRPPGARPRSPVARRPGCRHGR